jgi:glycosyltransferase involved in cell wall biosynthesis
MCVDRLCETLCAAGIDSYRILIVIDGPIPETVEAASKIVDERVTTRVLPMNRGKGFALRFGFSGLDEEIIAFLDGDLDIHPDVITKGISVLQDPMNLNVGCVYGSKHHIGSEIEYPAIRRALSAGFRLIARVFVGIDISDSQTGAKIFRGNALRECIDSVEEQGFLFDIELLSRLGRNGWSLYSIPVKIRFQYSSTIRLSEIIRMFHGTIRLALRLRFSKPGA